MSDIYYAAQTKPDEFWNSRDEIHKDELWWQIYVRNVTHDMTGEPLVIAACSHGEIAKRIVNLLNGANEDE